jgi:hypothetical protein
VLYCAMKGIFSHVSNKELQKGMEKHWKENKETILPVKVGETDAALAKALGKVKKPERIKEIVILSPPHGDVEAGCLDVARFPNLEIGSMSCYLTRGCSFC